MFDYVMESSQPNKYIVPFCVDIASSSNLNTNGTYIDLNKYFVFFDVDVKENKKDYIKKYELDCKIFGEKEKKAVKNIIKKSSIPIKMNYMDYYE